MIEHLTVAVAVLYIYIVFRDFQQKTGQLQILRLSPERSAHGYNCIHVVFADLGVFTLPAEFSYRIHGAAFITSGNIPEHPVDMPAQPQMDFILRIF